MHLIRIVALVLGLAGATFPAWRVVLLGGKPTIDELLALRCSAPAATPSGADMDRSPVPP